MWASAAATRRGQGEPVQRHRQDDRRRPHMADRLQGIEPRCRQPERHWIEERAGRISNNIWFDTPYSLGVAPTNPDVAYASDLFRTYRTLNGGVTWQEVDSKRVRDDNWTSRGLDVTTNYGMQFDPFDSQHIYMDNTDMGLFQSTDGGQSWRSTSEGVPGRLAQHHLLAGLRSRPARPDLGSLQWHSTICRGPRIGGAASPMNFKGGVAVSSDGGLHWSRAAKAFPSDSITHILLDPSSPRRQPHAVRMRLWPRRLQVH